MIEQFSFSLENLTQILLFVAAIIFLWITIKSKSIASFQFQISIFVLIWLAGEMIKFFQQNYMHHSDLGMQIHLAAMVYLSSMLWLRFYYSKKRGKKLVEGLDKDDNPE
jgi:hypothetical protein